MAKIVLKTKTTFFSSKKRLKVLKYITFTRIGYFYPLSLQKMVKKKNGNVAILKGEQSFDRKTYRFRKIGRTLKKIL